MKPKNLMIVVICALAGSRAYAQSFEKMVGNVDVTLRSGIHALQAAMSEPKMVSVAMNSDNGAPISGVLKLERVENARITEITGLTGKYSIQFRAQGNGKTSPLIRVGTLTSERALAQEAQTFAWATKPQLTTTLYMSGNELVGIGLLDGSIALKQGDGIINLEKVENARITEITGLMGKYSIQFQAQGNGKTSPLIRVGTLTSERALAQEAQTFAWATKPQLTTTLYMSGNELVGIDLLDGSTVFK